MAGERGGVRVRWLEKGGSEGGVAGEKGGVMVGRLGKGVA